MKTIALIIVLAIFCFASPANAQCANGQCAVTVVRVVAAPVRIVRAVQPVRRVIGLRPVRRVFVFGLRPLRRLFCR